MSETAEKSKTIKGRTGDWEIVLGIEVHAQVAPMSQGALDDAKLKALQAEFDKIK